MHSLRLTYLLLILLCNARMSYAQEPSLSPRSVRPLPPLSTSVRIEDRPAADIAVPIPSGRQVFYDLAQVTWIDEMPGISRKVVTGEIVTFSILKLKPETTFNRPKRALPFERILLQIEGVTHLDVDGHHISLTPMQAAIIPAGVAHIITGTSATESVVVLDFNAGRWTSPDSIPCLTPSASSPLPAEHDVVVDFNRLPWRRRPNGSKSKRTVGDSCYFNLWHFPRSTLKGAERRGHHHTAEQISMVLKGNAEMRIGNRIKAVGPGSLLMIPADVDHFPMTPIDNEAVLILDFQPIIRTKDPASVLP